MTHFGNSMWKVRDRCFPQLSAGTPKATESRFDSVVIGAGITGLTTALRLARQGHQVAVLEAMNVGAGETLRTTAHVTVVLDMRWSQLIKQLGREDAQVLLRGHERAVAFIAGIATEANCAECLAPANGLLIARTPNDVALLDEELLAAHLLRLNADRLDKDLPLGGLSALSFPNQSALDAGRYLEGLLDLVLAAGVQVYKNTRVTKITERDGVCTLDADNHKVVAKHVVVATHSSIANLLALHTRITANRSYVIAVPEPLNYTRALVWDMEDPYHYVRHVRVGTEDLLLVGGEDHRVGEDADADSRYKRLFDFSKRHLNTSDARYQWSGQILESVDGLPYIGPAPGYQNVYVATGFAGNGTTYGTLAALTIAEAIAGTSSALHDLFRPSRMLPLAAVTEYAKTNAGVVKHAVADRFGTTKVAEDIKPNAGAIVQVQGKKLAMYKDEHGQIHTLSAVCPHLGCLVAWNPLESTWDCPCHGSRFDCKGRVLNGPSTENLTAMSLSESDAEAHASCR